MHQKVLSFLKEKSVPFNFVIVRNQSKAYGGTWGTEENENIL